MIFNEDHEQNIDLKNRAEALCFEVEKELTLLKDKISENKQENITNLIQNIRNEIQNDNINALKLEIEGLKTAMKDMIDAKSIDNDLNSDPMSNLNDL
jgi:molecular chaperone DnaK (HSP70)